MAEALHPWSVSLAKQLIKENGGPLDEAKLAGALRGVARACYNKALRRAVVELEDTMSQTAAQVVDELPRL